MEHYINDNLSDITYKSELTPADSFCIRKSESKRRGLNLPPLFRFVKQSETKRWGLI